MPQCLLLAARTHWHGELQRVFQHKSRELKLPVALERSRSGRGGHVWFFFEEAMPAALVRKLGLFLLTETMERRPDIGLDSYDRRFPNQDTLPQRGFGNLIAMPLQKQARERGSNVFVDDRFEPHADQWAFLSTVGKLGRSQVESAVGRADRSSGVIGVRLPGLDEDEPEPWAVSPSRRPKASPIVGDLPSTLEVVLGNEIYVPTDGLVPGLRNRLMRIAALQNPEFYKAQAMRLPTYDKPRVIACAEQHPHHLGLPRGCLTLSSLGGLLGLALATFASVGLTRVMDLPYVFDAQINVTAILFSAAIGILFGYLPAKRAAALDPIEALRHE